MRVVLCTGDDARRVVGGDPHRLGLVELWILKRRQSKQTIPQAGMQPVFRDVDLVAQDQFQRFRKRPGERHIEPARWRRRPRAIVLVIRREPHAQDVPATFGILNDAFDARSIHSAQRAQERPLVRPRV
jgi:hypothetical protein